MLDAFIIEELRRREQAEREARERPVLRLPQEIRRAPGPGPVSPDAPEGPAEREPSRRGVVIIDMT